MLAAQTFGERMNQFSGDKIKDSIQERNSQ